MRIAVWHYARTSAGCAGAIGIKASDIATIITYLTSAT